MNDTQRFQLKQIVKLATEELHADKKGFGSDRGIRTAACIIKDYAQRLEKSAAETPEEAERRAAAKIERDTLSNIEETQRMDAEADDREQSDMDE